ncbi:hypothetical protein MTP03_34190 [Tsukamurella sp. PLM1]|nr:hypothetical protein MTP03_34190 [Tsukamurella sp. PLM1]
MPASAGGAARGAAVAPPGLEPLECVCGVAVLARAELRRGPPAGERRLVGPELPVAEVVVHGFEAVRIVELGREDGGHAERELIGTALGRKGFQYLGHAQVRRRPGLVEPFLAHGPRAVVREPRQVGVQDEREHARLAPRGRRCAHASGFFA